MDNSLNNRNLKSELKDRGALLHISRLYLAPVDLDNSLHRLIPRQKAIYQMVRDGVSQEVDLELIVDKDYLSGKIEPPIGAKKQDWILSRARSLGAQAALFTRLNQFQERVGSRVGIEKPGKVNMQLSIKNANEPNVVWTANYHYEDRLLADDFLKAGDYIKEKSYQQSNKTTNQILQDGSALALRDFTSKRAQAFQ